jgi:hypothetical protein
MITRPSNIEFEHVGIGTALIRNRLAVPLNQREYSWEESHIQDLFHDLANAIDSRKSSYFLGTIVLTRGEDGWFEVADGQQRLATTTILLAAIRDYFQERNDALLVQDLNQFLFTIVRETREFNPRLKLNVDDNEFFKNRILTKKGDEARRSAKPQRPSHFRIDQAAQLAAEHVQKIIATHSDPNKITRLNDWVTYIEESALVIVLKVPDDLNAYVMFETLNDRGLRTSQADLVKNYLFASADDRISEAQQKWASMNGALETLEQDDVTVTYLSHLIISMWGHVRERQVFEIVKDKVTAKQQSIDFLSALAEGANDYVAIQTPTHPKWNAYHPNIREHIRTMLLLDVSPLRPLALAIIRRFNKKQTELAFRQLVFWSVRYLIAGVRSGRVVELIHNAAKEVNAGKVDTASKLADHLSNLLLSDTAFKTEFATTKVSKSALARYYLRALEYKAQGNPTPEFVPNEDIVINLEHVLPEHVDEGWPSIDKAVAQASFKRLGNLVLLRAQSNSVIGNKSFEEKKATLLNSTFLLTQEAGKEKTWGLEEINKRQERLADLAVQVWPIRAE